MKKPRFFNTNAASTKCLFGTLLLLAASTAPGADLLGFLRDYDLNNYALGVSVSASQNPYSGNSDSLFAYPFLTSFRHSAFTDDWLLIRDENLGIRFIPSSDWEFGFIGRVQTLSIGSEPGDALLGLANRNWALETGPLIGWRGSPVHIQFRSYWEIPNRHSGTTSELEFSWPLEFSRGYFVPGVRLAYMSDDYSNYYFGVSDSEVTATRSYYEPGAGWNTRVGFSLGYEITPRWLLNASAGLEYLDPNISKSPIVDREQLWSGSIGLAYNANIFQHKNYQGSAKPHSLEIRVTGFNGKLDTEVRRDSSAGTPGDDISYEDTIGASDSDNGLQWDIYYRFGFYHRVEIGYFKQERTTTVTLNQDFEFGDEIFPADTEVVSNFDSTRSHVSYAYSLIRDNQKELGITAGLTFANFKFNIFAESTRQQEQTTVKSWLPTMGVFGSVNFGPDWKLGAEVRFFALDIDLYSGHSGLASLSLEKQLGQSFALGIGYDLTSTKLKAYNDAEQGQVQVFNHGPTVYMVWLFQ